MQNNIRIYANSSLPKNYTDYLAYLNSDNHNDTLILFDICLKAIFLNRFNEHLKFFILNNKFGSLAEILKRYKIDFLFISKYSYDYFTIPDEFKIKFKQIDWKNNILKINFNPHCVFDLFTYFNDKSDIDQFIAFLNNNNNPTYCGLIFFNSNKLDKQIIIDIFEKNNYLYEDKIIENINNKYNNVMNTISLTNLFIFSYINKDE